MICKNCGKQYSAQLACLCIKNKELEGHCPECASKLIEKTQKMIIAFDVDDTLIIPSIALERSFDIPHYHTIDLLRWFLANGDRVIIWSGGGKDYARMWAEKLGFYPHPRITISEKTKEAAELLKPDICFDDCIVDLAKVNIRVGRVNNGVSRKEWNEHKTGGGD